MKDIENLIKNLPDAESARRFLHQFAEKNPAQSAKLLKNEGLLADVLTLVSFSPLIAATLIQNPAYLLWLNRHRSESVVRGKDELLESLARFSLTNSQIEPQILLARFRRRELLRIFLRDIRRLGTIAEITEEISNVADAVLEYALQIARQEMDNRFGIPLETDWKNRARPAGFCVFSLGKLGSKELNYSSDIDLMFVYSADGNTSGQGTRGAVTNREYFVKLAEYVTKIVGQQTGEGAAYRVDLRLRPHGRVGALALSLRDTIKYYQTAARSWERQVLIRSRASAGDAEIYKEFCAATENYVFSKNETVENALENVRLSKEKINLEQFSRKEFNVKLGRGGIREIEFIAQALQLAHGGGDEWIRVPHTLISLSRLADRKYISETELTELFSAYDFLRHLEHLLQMEHGLQTHSVPSEIQKRTLTARRMNCADLPEFDDRLALHTSNVSRIFARIFSRASDDLPSGVAPPIVSAASADADTPVTAPPDGEKAFSAYQPILSSLEKSDLNKKLSLSTEKTLIEVATVSPYFAEMIAANPALIAGLPDPEKPFAPADYGWTLRSAIESEPNFARRIAILRKEWSRFLLEIAVFDVFEKITVRDVKLAQTKLAEACIEAALIIARDETERKFSVTLADFPFAVCGLGKLGGRGMDYGSDLDLILIYDDEKPLPNKTIHAEFYGRAVEIFVTALSALTRDGQPYRVDLRLRPDGKNGAAAISINSFIGYLQTRAAIWELLAYLKIRGVSGDQTILRRVRAEAGKIIHENARSAQNLPNLKQETLRIRERLEQQKAGARAGREVDIKFGAGGMLDVYFAMRYLQLRENIPDDEDRRNTLHTLAALRAKAALSDEDYANLSDGYAFLSRLDHQLRLTVGRSTKLPLANQKALATICRRMKVANAGELLEALTVSRLNIRASFDAIVRNRPENNF